MTKNRKRVVTLPYLRIEWALKAVQPAMCRDDVTPVLTGAFWEIDETHVTITTSDRYRVHQARLPRPKGASLGQFLMSGDQVRWILRNHLKRSHGVPEEHVLRIEWGDLGASDQRRDEDVILTTVRAFDGDAASALSYREHAVNGNFPPLGRLFTEVARAESDYVDKVGLNPRYLGDTRYLQSDRYAPLIYWTPRADRERSAKIAPLMVTDVAHPDKWAARALIQPNLLLR